MTKVELHLAMARAVEEAEAARDRGEVPVGACITGPDGAIVTSAGTRTRELNDPTAHAEILVIREAGKMMGSERLTECDLHVTLEPCAMCAAAISFARIARLYFGADDEKMGAVENGPRFFAQATCHHAPDVYSGLGEKKAREMLTQFFRTRR